MQVKSTVNDSVYTGAPIYNTNTSPVVKISFSSPVDKSTVAASVSMAGAGVLVANNYSYSNNDSTLVITPASALQRTDFLYHYDFYQLKIKQRIRVE